MKELFFVLVLSILISCQQNNKRCEVKNSNKDILIKSKSIFTYQALLPKSKVEKVEKLKKDTNIVYYKVSKLSEKYAEETTTYESIDFVFYTYKNYIFVKPNNPFVKRDYVLIENQKYVLDSIFNMESVYSTKKSRTDIYMIKKAYTFQFSDSYYYIFFLAKFLGHSSEPLGTYPLVLFSKNGNTKVLGLPYSSDITIEAFNDFDEDGHLDYIAKKYQKFVETDTLFLYSLDTLKNEFLKRNEYIIINKKQEIDIKNSKWFFDLGQK